MSDIVERLEMGLATPIELEAAAEIKRLRAELDKAIVAINDLSDVVKDQQAEIERLREVIEQVRELLDDGTLIRDTSHDWDSSIYVKQGLRITKMVAGIREALGDE
jgi:hypothetical protein